MGLYFVNCSKSGLFYLGLIQIIYNMQKRRDILDYIFAPVYIDPYTKEGWQKIEKSVGIHGNTKLVPSGATPSKHPRQGDGQFTPYTLDKSVASCTDMYNRGLSENIFVNPDDMKVEFTGDWDQIEQGNHMTRWNSICEGYETVEEMVRSTDLIWEAINPLFEQNGSVQKSPAQLFFFGGTSCLGKYFGNDSLGGPSWKSYEAFAQPSLDLLGTLFDNSRDVWFLPIPTLNEISVTSGIFNVPYLETVVEINDTGIINTPEIIDLTGPATTTVTPDSNNFNIINIEPQAYPIDTNPVSFRVRYTKMLLN